MEQGTKLGPYEILSPLGAGGMGEVYLARDTRLDRDVAIKALPEHLAQDSDRLARFEREAKTLAQLNHPNVAGIHGVEEHNGVRYLVLEYVEGETLSARLDRGVFPVDESLEIAIQIAAGVGAAHEAGVIHRDLKPGNVMVTSDGQAKVLDFGLARTEESSFTAVSPIDPTITTPAKHSPTIPGVILGTAAYMSPEQARGRKVDKRTDIWSFGVILYEMLTGVGPFVGETVSDSIGAVLHKEIDFDRLPSATPPMVRHVLHRCLTRDKSERLRDIGDVAIELRRAARGEAEIVDAGSVRTPRIPVVALAGMTVLMFGLGWIASKILTHEDTLDSGSPQVIFAQIAAPPGVVSAFHDGFALSPDGKTLAFAATDTSGQRQIWTRRLDEREAQPVGGTKDGAYPIWSPDSTQLAFVVDGELRRVSATGGPAVRVCETKPFEGRGGSWSSGDVILFSATSGSKYRIGSVDATGGDFVLLEELGHAWNPVWLSDGKRFLYVQSDATGEPKLRLASLEGRESALVGSLVLQDPGFEYSAGYIFQNRNEALAVQRFDEDTGQLIGSAVTIAGIAGTPKEWFALSAAADRLVGLVHASLTESGDAGDPPSHFEWFGRDGEPGSTFGPPGRYWTMRLSPDGNRVAANQGDELWVFDDSGHQMRIASGAAGYPPVWSPDGREIFSFCDDMGTLRQTAQPGSTPSILPNVSGPVWDVLHDGKWLLLRNEDTSSDIVLYNIQEHIATPWLATEFDEIQSRFSPDGKWVAYVSNAGGRRDVYVRPFEGDNAALVVSTGGGTHPVWRKDGNELFYLAPDGSIMASDVGPKEGGIAIGRPKALFRIPLNTITIDWFTPYDVAPDGQRFLLNVPDRPLPLLFVQGWKAQLQ